jgi:hypothetical protein
MRTRTLLTGLAAVSLTAVVACGSTSSHADHSTSSMPGMDMSHSGDSAGMSMPAGTGLATTSHGYTLALKTSPMAGIAMPATFTISKDGRAVTAFDPEQTKLMHLYLIRSDLTGFQHLHPTMSSDGTWSVTPTELESGSYRLYVQFLAHAHTAMGALVLSQAFTIDGAATSTPTPTTVDGYRVRLDGTAKAGAESPLRITISKDGRPVTNLQPYLDTFAHVTAIRAGDLAFAHLHPSGRGSGLGGPTLTVHADLPEPGRYRVFVQFQTAGTVRTAELTISAD